jgi:hypothetical protein
MATMNWPIELRMAAGAASRQSVVRSMPTWSARTDHPRIDDNPGFRGRRSRVPSGMSPMNRAVRGAIIRA